MSNKEWRRSLNLCHSFEMENETVEFRMICIKLFHKEGRRKVNTYIMMVRNNVGDGKCEVKVFTRTALTEKQRCILSEKTFDDAQKYVRDVYGGKLIQCQ